MAKAAPFENPLVPNARLKQMLLAMHRLRALEEALPQRKRAGAKALEACLVPSAIDLSPADIVSDALDGRAIAFLRGTPLARVLEPGAPSRKKPVLADAGLARPLPWTPRHEDRLWMALGAAAGLRSEPDAAASRPALVCFLRPGQVPSPTLRRAFQLAAEQRLPVVFVALPGSFGNPQGALGPIAARCGIPAIAADRDDAVAVYRVAQESLGRARSGGGPALIECVPFPLSGAKDRIQTNDPLRVVERYVLERRIVAPAWIARQAQLFARHLALPLH